MEEAVGELASEATNVSVIKFEVRLARTLDDSHNTGAGDGASASASVNAGAGGDAGGGAGLGTTDYNFHKDSSVPA